MTANLRALLARGAHPVVAPGASDALSARLIEAHGYECVYIGSYATAASRFAMPDIGLLSLEQLASQAKTIAGAVRVPVIADAEGGFDPAEAVETFEKAGVAAIHVEDHTGAGKHTDAPQELRPMKEAAARIRAAVAARKDPNFMIVARSDAFWVHRDLEDCIARLELYAEAGADMVFPTYAGPAELAEVRRRIAKPVMIIDMPGRTLAEHAGASVVLYYAFSITRQFSALRQALAAVELASDTTPLEDFLGYKDAPGRNR